MVKKTIKSIRTLLTQEQHEIISAASMLMLLLFISKLVGMVYLTLFADRFSDVAVAGGASQADLFLLASALPEVITNVILVGAISGSIIPIFIRIKEKKGDEQFNKSFSSTLNIGMLVFVIISILTFVFAEYLVPFSIELVQSSTTLTPAEVKEVVSMMRFLLIPQIFLAASAFVSAALNIYHRFIIPQLGPLFFNIGKIIGILFIVPMLDGSIWGLVWGLLIGSILYLLIQLPLLRHVGFGYKPMYFNFREKELYEVIKLGLPRTIALSMEQIAIIVDKLIAFGLTANALFTYSLGVSLLSIPLNLFGTSYSVASFPSLAKMYASGEKQKYEDMVLKIINQVLFLSIPVSVLMLILRLPLVRLLYGILGGFEWELTLSVAWVLMFFSLGVAFETLRATVFRIYYAVHNSTIPMISSIFVVVLGVITGIGFTNYLSHFDTLVLWDITFNVSYFFSRGDGIAGVGGLALSSSLVFTLEFFFLIALFKKSGVLSETKPLFRQIGMKVLAGIFMFIVGYLMFKVWEEILRTDKTLPLIMLTVSTSFAALMSYLWISYVMHIAEVEVFVKFVIQKSKLIISYFKN